MKARLWAYPWDLLDEGPEEVLERVADSGFDEISVAMVYHGGMLLLPHNPRRKVYFPEDGVAYFVPNAARYRDITPVASELTRDGDPLMRICSAAASRGLATLAWVVCLHNGRVGLDAPSVSLENAFGDRYPYALCPTHPRVRTFIEALVTDLSSRCGLAGIELEALYHQNYPHQWSHPKEGAQRTAFDADLLSLCFCEACMAAAMTYDVDAVAVRRSVRAYLDASLRKEASVARPQRATLTGVELDALIPHASAYLAVRTEGISRLVQTLCAASALPIHATVGSGLLGRERWPGIALHRWTSECKSLTVNCYSANASATVEEEIADAGTKLDGFPFRVGLQATWPQVKAAPQLLRRIKAAHAAGAEGVAIYNYGLMPLRHLDWVGSALAEVRNG